MRYIDIRCPRCSELKLGEWTQPNEFRSHSIKCDACDWATPLFSQEKYALEYVKDKWTEIYRRS